MTFLIFFSIQATGMKKVNIQTLSLAGYVMHWDLICVSSASLLRGICGGGGRVQLLIVWAALLLRICQLYSLPLHTVAPHPPVHKTAPESRN